MAEVAVYSSRVFLAHSFFLLAKEDAMALRLLSKFCTATLYVCPALANVEDLQRWERNDTCLHGTHHSGGSSSTPEKQKVSREPGLLSLSGSWLVFLKYKSSHVFYTWVGGGGHTVTSYHPRFAKAQIPAGFSTLDLELSFWVHTLPHLPRLLFWNFTGLHPLAQAPSS